MRATQLSVAALGFLFLAACGEKAQQEDVDQTSAQTAEEKTPVPSQEIVVESAEELAARAESNLAASADFLAENAKRDGVQVTESGLQYLILEEGKDDGFTPAIDDMVDVHYVFALKDGTEFDSSHARGAAARTPVGGFIKGWAEAIQMMSEGDRYRFFIPPDLAFGEAQVGPVGPNEALVFDVELLNVVNAERNLAAAEAFLADNLAKPGIKATQSGLQYEVVTEGPADGKTPNDASVVKVHYKGVLLNGSEFDSSYARGEPAEFPVSGVISGWTEGLQLMSEGDTFRFYIHPSLAYGSSPRPGGAIGPNDALIFDVELLEVK